MTNEELIKHLKTEYRIPSEHEVVLLNKGYPIMGKGYLEYETHEFAQLNSSGETVKRYQVKVETSSYIRGKSRISSCRCIE